jgi:hypothetical protein
MSINRIVLYLILFNGVLFLNAQRPVINHTAVPSRPVVAVKVVHTAVSNVHSQPNPSPETAADLYLQQQFCQDGLCADTDYAEWLIVDAESQWQVEDLQMVRHVLMQTIAALNDAGLDGRSLLASYRFRRFNGPYVEANDGLIGVVRHHSQEIVLADTAFQRMQGFYIYHELGHVVDRRTRRQLSQSYHHIAYGGYQVMEGMTPEQWETADGYWLRLQGRHDREEATADAFALWVAFAPSDGCKLIFANMPAKVHYSSIVWTVHTSLSMIKQDRQ